MPPRKATTITKPSTITKILNKHAEDNKKKKVVPYLMSYVVDRFIEDFIGKCVEKNDKEINTQTIIDVIRSNPDFDYLEKLIPRFEEIENEIKGMSKKKDKKTEDKDSGNEEE